MHLWVVLPSGTIRSVSAPRNRSKYDWIIRYIVAVIKRSDWRESSWYADSGEAGIAHRFRLGFLDVFLDCSGRSIVQTHGSTACRPFRSAGWSHLRPGESRILSIGNPSRAWPPNTNKTKNRAMAVIDPPCRRRACPPLACACRGQRASLFARHGIVSRLNCACAELGTVIDRSSSAAAAHRYL
jgi:hypothetical protein